MHAGAQRADAIDAALRRLCATVALKTLRCNRTTPSNATLAPSCRHTIARDAALLLLCAITCARAKIGASPSKVRPLTSDEPKQSWRQQLNDAAPMSR